MVCVVCSSEVSDKFTFCPQCGSQVKREELSEEDNQPTLRHLSEGTSLSLEFVDTLTSQSSTVGDRVNLILASELRDGDWVFGKRGAVAVGTVTRVERTGMLGRGGELNVRADYLKILAKRVPLRSSLGAHGRNKTGATIGMCLLFGPFGLIKRGSYVIIPTGARVTAYVDEDCRVAAEFSKREFFCGLCGAQSSTSSAACSQCIPSKPLPNFAS